MDVIRLRGLDLGGHTLAQHSASVQSADWSGNMPIILESRKTMIWFGNYNYAVWTKNPSGLAKSRTLYLEVG